MKVNGNDLSIETLKEKTINSLFETLNIEKKTVVLEINHEIIVKEDYNKVELRDSDIIEIIHFVGGGWKKH
ncbi:MAG: sulfur carrier protein ThiS [Spirochaetia bacterium]|nr:sulfur carrier protein ThiS [Spirochaetia bacterium]